jgi:hypothetical protein
MTEYTITFARSARRELERLDNSVLQVFSGINLLGKRPSHVNIVHKGGNQRE